MSTLLFEAGIHNSTVSTISKEKAIPKKNQLISPPYKYIM